MSTDYGGVELAVSTTYYRHHIEHYYTATVITSNIFTAVTIYTVNAASISNDANTNLLPCY